MIARVLKLLKYMYNVALLEDPITNSILNNSKERISETQIQNS